MTTCSNCGQAYDSGFKFCPSCGTQSAGGEAPGSLIGRIFNDKYRVLSEIGAGGMGRVYLGEHIGLRKKVALKVLHSDLEVGDESLSRFQREGIAAGRFNHPNAIQIFDFDRSAEGSVYLAMEFVEGLDLKAFLQHKGRLAPAVAVDIICQVLSCLDAAHQHNIIHRDLKPDNVMVVETPSVSVKVLDFGLSKLVDVPLSSSLQTQQGRLLGTPLYMAPEQCMGEEADERSDLYAVGLLLYELLSGLTAFPDVSATEIIFTRPKREAPSLTESHPDLGIPAELDEILQKALQRRREDRYQTAGEMLADVEAVRVGGEAAIARASSHSRVVERPAEPAAPAGSRKRLVWAAVLVLALIVAGVGGSALFRGGSSSTTYARVSLKPESERTPEEIRYVVLLEQAQGALARGDGAGARAAADQAAMTACVDAEAYFLRARAYRMGDEDDIARVDLEEALTLDPAYAQARAALGWLQLDAGEIEAAQATFDQALEDDPDLAAALGGRGALHRGSDETDEARELLERAVALDASSARSQLELARLDLDEGDLEGARAALLQAKRGDPRSWRVAALLGEVLLASGEIAPAERNLRAALDANPRLGPVRAQLAGLLLADDRGRQAESVIDEGLRQTPDDPQLLALRGAREAEAGEGAEAIRTLERAARSRPDDVRTQTLLALLYQEEGRSADALEAYDHALAVDDELAAAHFGRGLALFALDRFEEAAQALEQAVRLAPEDVEARYVLGTLYYEYLGLNDQALLHLSAYQELGGTDQRARQWLRELERGT